tara:strand:+ start:371 stop:1531 length:1161 start_codon:yes stop_codon:yes gene_type:complete
MDEASPTLVDLFSGCGGLGLGFHQAGFETICANELHPDPATTYSLNLLKEDLGRMRVGSIKKVMSNKKIEELALNNSEIDCVAGGPPCQGFSMAGKGDPDDRRNFLFKEYLRVVRKIRPKSIIFENVPGFANRYGRGLRERLVRDLSRMGYTSDYGVLQAHDYGVPQLRKRFVCIGIHKDWCAPEEVRLPKPTWSKNEIDRKLTTRKVIEDLDVYTERGGYGSGEVDGPENYLRPAKSEFQKLMRKKSGVTKKGFTWNTKIPLHTPLVSKRMGKMQRGASLSSFRGTELETDKLSQRVLEPNKCPRITVVSIPDDYVHYNQELPRTLSVRECARLQTFPDHFRFHGKRTTGGHMRKVDVPQYTQVGNAIPPRLAKTLAKSLLSSIM